MRNKSKHLIDCRLPPLAFYIPLHVCACVCVFARTLWHVAHGSRRRTADAGTATATTAAAASQLISPASFLSHTIFRTLLPCLVPVAASTFVLCAIKKKKERKICISFAYRACNCTKVCAHTHLFLSMCVCTHLSIVQRRWRRRAAHAPLAELVSFSRSCGGAAFEL